MRSSFFIALVLALSASSRPALFRRVTQQAKDNGAAAKALNAKFATAKVGDACTTDGCIGPKFAPCLAGKFIAQDCGAGTKCAALPLVNGPGTSVACTTQADIDQRFAATVDPAGAAAPPPAAAPPAAAPPAAAPPAAAPPPAKDAPPPADGVQASLTLDKSVIATGFANDGQDQPEAGQVPSLTSKNNFINFCAGQEITNGKQVTTGSCNPAPMGQIAAKTVMPSCKFVFPPNLDKSLKANTKFTIKMVIKNLQTGNFVNAQQNYFSAPQQVDKASGIIIGHSHVVIEKLDALDSIVASDPTKFVFFKGLNGKADAQGILTADVTDGLPAGFYKLSSINSAANHQPALVAVAQHGSLDDAVYFTVN